MSRKRETRVIVHPDQATQCTNCEWQELLKEHGLDNAVAESFFQLLKRERIKKRIY